MLELEVYDTEFRAHGRVMGFQVEFARVSHGHAVTPRDARGNLKTIARMFNSCLSKCRRARSCWHAKLAFVPD